MVLKLRYFFGLLLFLLFIFISCGLYVHFANAFVVVLIWEIFLSSCASLFLHMSIVLHVRLKKKEEEDDFSGIMVNPLTRITQISPSNSFEKAKKELESVKWTLRVQLESAMLQVDTLTEELEALRFKLNHRNASQINPRSSSSLLSFSSNRPTTNTTQYLKSFKWRRGPKIGLGSTSLVFMGIDVQTGSFFACKQRELDCRDHMEMETFKSESELLSSLNHENIVQHFVTVSTNFFEELIYPGSLQKVIAGFGALEEAIIVRYTFQILQALVYLHNRKIVHRDIKSDNILVDLNGRVRLCDFGAALRGSKPGNTKNVCGSSFWMSPEILAGKYGTSASDIWSMACVVIEMATGKPPYPHLHDEENEMTLLYQLQESGSPNIPDSVSLECRELLQQCLCENPKDRPSASTLSGHIWFGKIMHKDKSLPSLFMSRGFSQESYGIRKLHNASSHSTQSIATSTHSGVSYLDEVCMSEVTLSIALKWLSAVRTPRPISHYIEIAEHEAGYENANNMTTTNVRIQSDLNTDSHSDFIVPIPVRKSASALHSKLDAQSTIKIVKSYSFPTAVTGLVRSF